MTIYNFCPLCKRSFELGGAACPKCGAKVPSTGKTFRVDVMVKGKRVRQVVKNSITVAKQIEAKLKTSILEDTFVEKKKDLTLDEVFEAYHAESVAQKKRNTSRVAGAYRIYIQPEFGRRQLHKISPAEVQKWQNQLYRTETQYKRTLSPKTIKDLTALFKMIYAYAARVFSYDKSNPLVNIKFPKVNNIVMNILTADQSDRLLNALNQMKGREVLSANIIRVLYFTGMRRSEVFRMKWADIDFENKVITVPQAKSGYSRKVQMNSAVEKVLMFQQGFSNWSELVFPGYKNGVRHDIERAWANIKRLADLPAKIRLHDLRHNFISRALNKEKIPVPIVAELAGHSDWRTTMRYTHPTRDELKEAAEKLAK